MFLAIQNENLCKKISLKEGKIDTGSTHFPSDTMAIAANATLQNIFYAISTTKSSIVLGYFDGLQQGQHVRLLSAQKLNEFYPNLTAPFLCTDRTFVTTRSKKILKQAKILVLDFDIKDAPLEYANLTPAEYIEKLSTIFEGFKNCGFVYNYSSRAGICTSDGIEVTPVGGFHIYIEVLNPSDIDRFTKTLFVRLLLAGVYWFKDGETKPLTLIDMSAFSAEHLFFEVAPQLQDGLVRKVPSAEYIQGEVLNTELFPDLSAEEITAFETKFGNKGLVKVKSTNSHELKNLTKHDNLKLKPDTIISLTDGTQTTPKNFYASGQDKVKCYVPLDIRVDNNPSGVLFKHSFIQNIVCIHDFSFGITYFCNVDTSFIPAKRFDDVDSTIENFNTLLTFNNILIHYDVIKKDISISIPDQSFLPDNQDNAVLATLQSIAISEGFKIGESRLSKYIAVIADKYHRNPVEEFIKSKKHDGVDRIAQLAYCLVVLPKYEAFKIIALVRWLIGCVASALSIEGNKNEIILVLVGDQGMGKTSFFNSLVPLNSGWLKDGVHLDPNNKDHVKLCASHWIVELGELDGTFKRAEVSALKAFLSSTTDEIRLPYAATFSKFPRRTAFCASVNSSTFLVDDTGNRRFSTLEVTEVKRHNIDIQQLWAQVLTLYESGEQWWYTPEEEKMQAELNAEHQVIEPIEELLINNFDFNNKPFNGPLMNPTAVMQALGYKTPNRADTTKMGNILKKKGLVKHGKKYQMPSPIYHNNLI